MNVVVVEDGVIEIDGKTYIAGAQAPRFLGVRSDRLRDWKRRGLITAVKWDGRNWYPLSTSQNVEVSTNGHTKPRVSTRG